MGLEWDELPTYTWYHIRDGIRDSNTYNTVDHIKPEHYDKPKSEVMWHMGVRSSKNPRWDVIVDWSE